jgi:hypothetical protein
MNPFSSFSHSAILASWFSGTLEEDFLICARRIFRRSLENDPFKGLLNQYRVFHSITGDS